MIPFLPIETLQKILEYVREAWLMPTRDLARCCRTSKTFLAIAQPLLFHNVKIEVGIAEDYHDYGEKQFHFKSEGQQVVKTLRSHPHLREMVTQVSFEGIDYASWDNNYDEDPSDMFDPLVELLDNRTVIALRKLSQYYDIDHAIFSAQTKFAGKAAPLFRRVFNARPNDHEDDQFESAYEGYQTDRYPWYPEYEKLLHGSFDTLTRLDIHFASFTALTRFHRLERLTLRLNDALNTEHENIGVDRDLVTLLPTLTSLRFLILTNTTDVGFDPTDLLESGSLAESLPPNLTKLSFDLVLEPSQVLAFLQRLPQATSLEKLNYRWRNDENQGVVGECRKRGIELRLNQNWEIW